MSARLEESGGLLNEMKAGLRLAAADRVREADHRAARLKERLTAVNPMAVLNRGYAMVFDGEKRVISSAREAGKKDAMTLQFADGRVSVTRKGQQ
jgi:exodeoxyribonuclease VII large subunit